MSEGGTITDSDLVPHALRDAIGHDGAGVAQVLPTGSVARESGRLSWWRTPLHSEQDPLLSEEDPPLIRGSMSPVSACSPRASGSFLHGELDPVHHLRGAYHSGNARVRVGLLPPSASPSAPDQSRNVSSLKNS